MTASLAGDPPAEVVERWRKLRDQAADNAIWQAELARERAFREMVGPRILTLLHEFQRGSVGLVEFQTTLDRKSRTEWNILGLKGASGAMFLNMLVKHVPDEAALSSWLQLAFPLPQDSAEGETKIRQFTDHLNQVIASKGATIRQLQPARTPFLLSAFWHLQESEAWPVFYLSARNVFSREGIYRELPNSRSVTNYVSYRRLWLSLRESLALDSLGLERLILWIDQQHVLPKPDPPGNPIPPPVPVPDPDGDQGSVHAKAQWLLARIGQHLGYKVWIAINDRSRRWQGQSLGDLSLASLPPLGAGGATQRTVELIDVLWISGFNQIVAAFEVEHSTAIYSGLLRMSDLAVLAPSVSFPIYIVAPGSRLDDVRKQLRRPTFQQLELHRRAAFFAIESLERDAEHIMRFATSPTAIDVLSERVGDVNDDEGWQ